MASPLLPLSFSMVVAHGFRAHYQPTGSNPLGDYPERKAVLSMVATAVVNGKSLYFIRETHGRFDDEEKRAVSVTETLFYKDGLESGAEAAKLFEEQVQHRVNEGFAHFFSIDPYTGMVYEYLG
jgi:hypothetical protein